MDLKTIICLIASFAIFSSGVFADPAVLLRLADTASAATDESLFYESSNVLDKADKPSRNAEEKDCMMACEQWGEDCVINPRTGQKKCRRVCKKMAQHCF